MTFNFHVKEIAHPGYYHFELFSKSTTLKKLAINKLYIYNQCVLTVIFWQSLCWKNFLALIPLTYVKTRILTLAFAPQVPN